MKAGEKKKERVLERKTEKEEKEEEEEGRVTFKDMHHCQAHSCLKQIGIPIQYNTHKLAHNSLQWTWWLRDIIRLCACVCVCVTDTHTNTPVLPQPVIWLSSKASNDRRG